MRALVSYTTFALSTLRINSILLNRSGGSRLVRAVLAAGLSLMARSAIPAGAIDRGGTNGLAEIRSMVVDGAPISPYANGRLRLSSRTRSVTFGLGPTTNTANNPVRIRFKLDGYDKGWREYDGSMRLCVRFLDATGDQISETVFRVAGQSAGWTGSPETAPFRQREESIVVPPRATSFWVVMSSAGPPATVGVYAISNLVVKTQPSNGALATVSLPWPFATIPGVAVGGTPAGWMRDGLRPSMATIFESASALHNRGFAIVDNDLRGHAEWHTIKEMATAVTPGDRLTVEWSEAYSFGLAEQVEVPYLALPAGYYRFRINEVSLTGIPSEQEASVDFEVPLVFWRTPWFWVSVVTIVLAAGAGGWRYAVWRRMHFQLQRLEQQRAVDCERLRIAQDIHDDLGARVTQISLLSAVAQGKAHLPEEARADFRIVSQMTRDLVSALYETVWAVNPENDNFDALATYLCQMGNQFCSQARLRCRLEVPDLPAQLALSSEVRHNLIMAVKEALHNVIKHARASEARLRITFTADRGGGSARLSDDAGSVLTICVQDDGCGFDPAACPSGNGLANVKRRMEKLGGNFTIESRRAVGTTVTLRLTVAGAASAEA
ncbi:MAG TPA: sensor histidine kinase [Verrucomicrobiae bacterium]